VKIETAEFEQVHMIFSSLFIFLTVILKITCAMQPTIQIKHFINNPYANTPTLHMQMQDSSMNEKATGKKLDSSVMKISDIQAELRSLNYSYTDCFDRDSLMKRLSEARSAGRKQVDVKPVNNRKDYCSERSNQGEGKSPKERKVSSTAKRNIPKFDRKATAQELRSLRVSELRGQLASRNIRWGNMLEKEDLVNALLDALEASRNFSVTGALAPSKVCTISDEELRMELKGSELQTPLLVDVYATWCGPCQLMMAQMDAAALEFGLDVRVAKIDSDKYPEWSSSVQVNGLPTLILFNKDGKEIDRKEGVLMKDELVSWVQGI